jgi:hypothetical protein
VWFVFFGAPSGSALDRFLSATPAALLASLGVWFLLQANAKVTIGPTALALRTTGGLRVITVKWDDIDAIAWRPPVGGSVAAVRSSSRRWTGGV